MDVFSLRDTVVAEYEQFATSFTRIHAADIQEQVRSIYREQTYWPEPLIQVNPNYRRSSAVADLVAQGTLHPGCVNLFPLDLFEHQRFAASLAKQRQSYVVTTGTGSGKSLCFFIPIVSAILGEKERDPTPRTRAIVIYPMNALANSQEEELKKFVSRDPSGPTVTFARYTGQESQADRERVRDNPPDILLTNFMMLELLMTRQDPIDRAVIRHCEGLRFLALDELHTYRGRQGADVAMLVRRVRERLAPDLLCIGTSATMKSDGSAEERRRVVADVASRLFACAVHPVHVIGETLERVTTAGLRRETVTHLLGPAIDAGLRDDVTDAELCEHPLAIWVETVLGMNSTPEMPAWHRAPPRKLSDVTKMLAEDAGRPEPVAREALFRLLLLSSLPESERVAGSAGERPFFAFKLHQFISGAGQAFATLEPPPVRKVTVDGQVFHPEAPAKRLYGTFFCRACGQEYHPVRIISSRGRRVAMFRDIDDAVDDSEPGDVEGDDGPETIGFVSVRTPDLDRAFSNDVDQYPESWREETGGGMRLKADKRKGGFEVLEIQVEPNGTLGSGAAAWLIPGRFRFCLRCGDYHEGASRDRNRLASLSAEGRSSATTVLTSSILRWMHSDKSGMKPETRKLLGFSDNRQDAALQAGHFNDFMFVSLTRAAFLRALDRAGEDGIPSDEIGARQQRALGFDSAEAAVREVWLNEPEIFGAGRLEAERTLRDVLAYRVWFDQRRGWRYTNPNLEQLGLVRVSYLGLDEVAARDDLFANAPSVLARAASEVRAQALTVVLDHLRRGLAIRSTVLDDLATEQLYQRSTARLRAPWGFAGNDRPQAGRWLVLKAPPRNRTREKDEELIVRGGSRTALGKKLRTEKLWGTSAIRDLKAPEIDALIGCLLRAAELGTLVVKETTPFDQDGWKLLDAAVVFHRAEPEGIDKRYENAYFRDLYLSLAGMLGARERPLFGFEAREHTAQVEQEKRQIREKRFRWGRAEQEELREREKELRDLGDAARFLPVLFCSPTMELGVDIAALNVVYLRNVPPTPANYAQRSGRAGRSGQAALVLTYASSQGPHDQFFFRDPSAMVHGDVRAPTLDLANRDLIDSHLQATWLSCTETVLSPSIAELIEIGEPGRPVRADLRAPMARPEVTRAAVHRMGRVLDLVASELTAASAPWYPGRDAYAREVADRALSRFELAFDRWRDLYRAAEQQRDAARRILDDHSASPHDKRSAKTRHDQAIDQLALLQQGDEKAARSDFYTYRYLATEGFLPGYNFPRLPLMAYVPKVDAKGKQAWLQRPRFLALSEFGPKSLVYHEGRAFRVVRAMLSAAHQDAATADTRLTTESCKVCASCGAGHFTDRSTCHACGAPLGDGTLIINQIYRIENVATWPAERITANDEERQRQGFDLQTTFEWATRDGRIDARTADVADSGGVVLRLAYGPGARITRINKGLRRRKENAELGFWIDPVSGYWKPAPGEEASGDPGIAAPQLIVPCVRDHKNALLVLPVGPLEPVSLATLQHALVRGLETTYQLEQGEILAEPVPSREDRKGFLLYEATEGGAGVLSRLVAEPGELARTAVAALEIMHFRADEGGFPGEPGALAEEPTAACVAGCYRCLLSYYNQPEHALIHRKDVGALTSLLRLARAATRTQDHTVVGEDAAPSGWLDAVRSSGLPLPDAITGELHQWRASYVAAALPGASREEVRHLADLGVEVVPVGEPDTWPDALAALARALGVTP
jgi:hypothetical protein